MRISKLIAYDLENVILEFFVKSQELKHVASLLSQYSATTQSSIPCTYTQSPVLNVVQQLIKVPSYAGQDVVM